MPKVSEQVPSRKGVNVSNGSVLSRATPVGDMTSVPLKTLIYGQSGVGKTYLSSQWPKPLLLLGFEPAHSGGAETVKKVEGVFLLKYRTHFTNTREVAQIAEELKVGKGCSYASVVLDSVTSLQDIILAEILNLPAVPDQLSWGAVTGDQYKFRSEKLRQLLRPFIDMEVDTVFIAKEKDHNPPKEEKISEKTGKVQPDMRPIWNRGLSKESRIASDIGGATVEWLQDACDAVTQLFIREEMVTVTSVFDGKEREVTTPTGKYTRYLRTTYHPNYAARVRSQCPEKVPEVIMDPSYEKLMQVIRGEV